jgi:large subunit ribosomal protein L21
MANSDTSAAASSAATLAGSSELYAIVVDGGRQYRVSEGQVMEIDFRHLAPGSEVVFDRVLAVSKAGKLTVGKPVVKGAAVKAAVIGSVQGDKIYVQKFARRKNYRRRTGHRSLATKIRIDSIAG